MNWKTYTAVALLGALAGLLYAGSTGDRYTPPQPAADMNTTVVQDITYITEEIITYNETTEIIIKGKGDVYYQINFDLNDVNFLLTESADYDRTVVMTSNTTDFEQLIIDANLVLDQELDVNGVATFNGEMNITDTVVFSGDPNQGATGSTETVDFTDKQHVLVLVDDDVTFTFTDPTTTGIMHCSITMVWDGAHLPYLTVMWNSSEMVIRSSRSGVSSRRARMMLPAVPFSEVGSPTRTMYRAPLWLLMRARGSTTSRSTRSSIFSMKRVLLPTSSMAM